MIKVLHEDSRDWDQGRSQTANRRQATHGQLHCSTGARHTQIHSYDLSTRCRGHKTEGMQRPAGRTMSQTRCRPSKHFAAQTTVLVARRRSLARRSSTLSSHHSGPRCAVCDCVPCGSCHFLVHAGTCDRAWGDIRKSKRCSRQLPSPIAQRFPTAQLFQSVQCR